MAWFIYTIKHSFPSKLFPIKLSIGNGSWPWLSPWLRAGTVWQSASWPGQMHAGGIHPLCIAAFINAREEQVGFRSQVTPSTL